MSSDDDAPAAAAPPEQACRERVAVQRTSLWSESAPPGSLPEQRWGVVVPAGPRGDTLLGLVAELIALREAEQGGPARVYRLPTGLDEAGLLRWKQEVFRPGDRLDDELPRYQLLLGDLHELPLAAQQLLGSDGFTGRLAFDRDEDYRAYAQKVCRWERAPAAAPAGEVLLFGAQDGTEATALGHEALLRPGAALLEDARARGRFAGTLRTAGLEAPEGPEALLALGRDAAGATLLSLSHGEGPPRAGWPDGQTQRHRQGALRFGALGRLDADRLREGAFLPGGAWLCFACYGAGTPDHTRFARWLAELRARGAQAPSPAWVESALAPAQSGGFVAALPKAALANPDGPLAFLGHMDLAWSHSFTGAADLGRSRPARFIAVLRALAQGHRAGVAHLELGRFLEQANSELTTLLGAGEPVADLSHLSHLWILRQDLACYTLLGDPAVRLPLGQRPAPGPPAAALPSTASEDPQEWEEAIADLIRGAASPAELAARLNVAEPALHAAAAAWREAGLRALGLSGPR